MYMCTCVVIPSALAAVTLEVAFYAEDALLMIQQTLSAAVHKQCRYEQHQRRHLQLLLGTFLLLHLNELEHYFLPHVAKHAAALVLHL